MAKSSAATLHSRRLWNRSSRITDGTIPRWRQNQSGSTNSSRAFRSSTSSRRTTTGSSRTHVIACLRQSRATDPWQVSGASPATGASVIRSATSSEPSPRTPTGQSSTSTAPSKVRISPSQLAEYSEQYLQDAMLLRMFSIFATSTVVFIGASLQDADLMELVRRSTFHTGSRPASLCLHHG